MANFFFLQDLKASAVESGAASVAADPDGERDGVPADLPEKVALSFPTVCGRRYLTSCSCAPSLFQHYHPSVCIRSPTIQGPVLRCLQSVHESWLKPLVSLPLSLTLSFSIALLSLSDQSSKVAVSHERVALVLPTSLCSSMVAEKYAARLREKFCGAGSISPSLFSSALCLSLLHCVSVFVFVSIFLSRFILF